MAECEQSISHRLGDLAPAAHAYIHLAKIRMAQGHVLAQVAYPTAVRAIGIPQRRADGFNLRGIA